MKKIMIWVALCLSLVWMAGCKAGSTSTHTLAPSPTPNLAPFSVPTIIPPEATNPSRPIYSNPGKYPVAEIFTGLRQGTDLVEVYIFYPAKADGTPETTGAPFPLVIYAPRSRNFQHFLCILA